MAALLAAGALGLHELRYLISWGSSADTALERHGHAYLGVAAPLVAALLAIALAQLVLRLARPRASTAPARGKLWLGAGVALLAIYASQETLEGLLAGGHPGGLAGVFGHGGLVALPLAFVIGGLTALAERSVRTALAAPASVRMPGVLSFPRALSARRPTLLLRAIDSALLAMNLAGRAPPKYLR
jgi:hypothetical protein